MRWQSILDADIRAKYVAIGRKAVVQRLRRPCVSRPVFVLGKQRSGTSMLMFCFHRHPDVLVFDEHRNNQAFEAFRLREADEIRELLQEARLPFLCFKPICDSHHVGRLLQDFPDAHCIWIYRDFRDVAHSSLRKFEAPTRAIRLVCKGEDGGGWFQEGLSPAVAAVLRDVYRPDLPAFDLSCLVWWARNRIILEQGVADAPNVTLLKYETLVTDPEGTLRWLFARTGIPYDARVARNIRASSVGRHAPVSMDSAVQGLCEEMMASLDGLFYGMFPSTGVEPTVSAAPGAGISEGAPQ